MPPNNSSVFNDDTNEENEKENDDYEEAEGFPQHNETEIESIDESISGSGNSSINNGKNTDEIKTVTDGGSSDASETCFGDVSSSSLEGEDQEEGKSSKPLVRALAAAALASAAVYSLERCRQRRLAHP